MELIPVSKRRGATKRLRESRQQVGKIYMMSSWELPPKGMGVENPGLTIKHTSLLIQREKTENREFNGSAAAGAGSHWRGDHLRSAKKRKFVGKGLQLPQGTQGLKKKTGEGRRATSSAHFLWVSSLRQYLEKSTKWGGEMASEPSKSSR